MVDIISNVTLNQNDDDDDPSIIVPGFLLRWSGDTSGTTADSTSCRVIPYCDYSIIIIITQ